MATTLTPTGVQHIGETAGHVWSELNDSGPMSMAKLVREIGQPRDVVMQAVGWLAREDKLLIEDTNRGRRVSLIQ